MSEKRNGSRSWFVKTDEESHSMEMLGFDVESGAGGEIFRLEVKPTQTDNGVVHGGILAALEDPTAAIAGDYTAIPGAEIAPWS